MSGLGAIGPNEDMKNWRAGALFRRTAHTQIWPILSMQECGTCVIRVFIFKKNAESIFNYLIFLKIRKCVKLKSPFGLTLYTSNELCLSRVDFTTHLQSPILSIQASIIQQTYDPYVWPKIFLQPHLKKQKRTGKINCSNILI